MCSSRSGWYWSQPGECILPASLLCISSLVSACPRLRNVDAVTVTGASRRARLQTSFTVHCSRRLSDGPPVVDGAENAGDKHRLMKINASSSCFTALDRPLARRPQSRTSPRYRPMDLASERRRRPSTRVSSHAPSLYFIQFSLPQLPSTSYRASYWLLIFIRRSFGLSEADGWIHEDHDRVIRRHAAFSLPFQQFRSSQCWRVTDSQTGVYTVDSCCRSCVNAH